MTINEVELTDEVMKKLISLSRSWEAENSCYGYRANGREDIEGNRIFLAEEGGEVLGYLFGKVYLSEKMKSIMPEGTPFFEVEELYVIPSRRSRGIGAELFRFAEDALKNDAEFMVLSTATKNWQAVFHFYLDELDMSFWSARLFKRISGAEEARDMEHRMKLWHDSFVKIKEGTKTIEMRLFDEKRAAISVGDTIVFEDVSDGACLECTVVSLYRYPSFAELYAHNDKVSIGYGKDEKADPADMLTYYSEEDIRKYGALGIEVRVK